MKIIYLWKGIGQQLLKKDKNANDCCYYLHCATYDYPVTPDPKNDIENAKDFKTKYENKALSKQIHLIPSITFPNLQQPENNTRKSCNERSSWGMYY